ncbi:MULTISPECIES: hypothetical protein [unclassified Variovorax]|uniref:hypothetical protein n=1 Tax=unclassified Variovorax TaxID=663243 RepID=UPI001316B8F2|nr:MULTISPECIES: hypothetical protein [unclassified Variovorax]VTU42029.1 hypothetical protein SRS16P1_00178 [Variovorax sp. SRS16]VTU42063.1 hypothetical protein E5P1_00176 [Variovorax sp. PBL-E5]VTU44420.1 hypothetical protein H6P1_00755 [Variovorax sp. PBL-H6]
MPTQAPKRFYGDDNLANPAAELRELRIQLHATYTHWIARNWHPRDFVCAVEHTADVAFASFLLEGSPDFSGEPPPPLEPAILAVPRSGQDHGAPIRFYDELSSLSPEIDPKALDRVLAPHFIRWVLDGWLARDFKQAASACAAGIVYDHHLCSQLGGLGGGRTALEFLTESYRFVERAAAQPAGR